MRARLHLLCVALMALSVTAMMAAAGLMTTDRLDFNPELTAYLDAGGVLEDVCADGDIVHDHGDCPLCREVQGDLAETTHRPMVALEPGASISRCTSTHHIAVAALTGHPARAPPARL